MVVDMAEENLKDEVTYMNENKLNDSYLTPEAKDDINKMLGGGNGKTVIAEINSITGGATTFTMTYDEIKEHIANGDNVIAKYNQFNGDTIVYTETYNTLVGNDDNITFMNIKYNKPSGSSPSLMFIVVSFGKSGNDTTASYYMCSANMTSP